jgi:FAD/FMN-containing dehydrogenase/Fe-S oxidoreductase
MRPTVTAIERDLRGLLRGDVEFDSITRHLYATDGGLYQIEPLGVVSPRDAEDVRRLVEYASENAIPLVPRGSGSGLAGAAVGSGLQVDFTRYMNRLLEMAPDGSWARVQPGLVMGVLNVAARPYGTFFAPNPSSENYCSLGGMMANNSSGGRSVAYGGTKDHVLGLEVALAGGELFAAGSMPAESTDLQALLESGSAGGRAFARVIPLLREKQGAIAAAMPRVMKNCSGYRVEQVLKADRLDLHSLFVGSEGTLGLITEATLNLVPLPGRRAIGMAYFPSVFAAGEAVHPILELEPTSLEIMDSNFLSFVRRHNAKLDDMLPPGVDTALLVEFEAPDDGRLDEQLRSLESLLAGGTALQVKRALGPAEQKQLWAIRQAAVPLLQKLPGPRRIAEFIEDVTVHPEVLAEYMSTLDGILKRRGVECVMYGHAGDGNIHTRPLLDLKDRADLDLMQKIMDEVVEVVLGLKGTPSGEHGDGWVRTPYIPQVYGTEVYGVFEEVKRAFDPDGIMNPGKKVFDASAGGGVARSMRYGPDYRTHEQNTYLHFPAGGYEREIEKCHGCSQCRSLVGTTMCPTYKATRLEQAAPRAKANLLRNIITGRLDPEDSYAQAAVKQVTDYCIECGMCALECPSNVNIPKLMLEAKGKYRAANKPSPTEVLLGNAEYISRAGSYAAALASPVRNAGLLRALGERLVGIDRRRRLPPFARTTYSKMIARREAGETAVQVRPFTDSATWPEGDEVTAPAAQVAFFYDLYANYHEPALAQTMDNLLRAHGVAVAYPEQRASGIPEMLYGFRERAQRIAQHNVSGALPLVKAGNLVVTGEPTASFAFKVHYPDYLASEDCSLVANATRDLGEFLLTLRADHPERGPAPQPLPLKVAYHQPCHLKAQQVGKPFLELLREVPDLEVVDLDAGCCGMAGTFGMKAGTYDLSMRVGEPLFARIRDSGADTLLSECSTCRMQLEEGTSRRTLHPAELLARAYGL